MIDGYTTIRETAERWDVTVRQVQYLCAKGQVEGAVKFGRAWAIPKEAKKPTDGRVTTGEYRNWRNNDKSCEE